jgi:Zn-dependent protease with chaperone function
VASTATLYPPSPLAVPPNLTQVSANYRRQVVIVLACMTLFILLYISLLTSAGWLVYQAITYSMGSVNKLTLLLKFGAVACSLMLFAFLVKVLFKSAKGNDADRVEVTEAQHPELFRFIGQVCAETGAPQPHKIYLSAEVNACVFYNSTFWSLFLPVKKNLLIGLGLVNSLNLSEFKAVIAHEFGHFAQSSMKLGSYVYMANRIIYAMVYDRDKWDDLLHQWQRSDFRIAVFGWILGGFVWLVRQLMALIYRLVNLVHAALSRQMEFHADSVAVSVAGSQAIVNALYRLDFAGDSLLLAVQDLDRAKEHDLYSADLFYHQTQAQARLRKQNKDPQMGIAPSTGPGEWVFAANDTHVAAMYASHPTNREREANAKRILVEGPVEDRSPWLLFTHPDQVRAQITALVYKLRHQYDLAKGHQPLDQVQAFIDNEHQALDINERYAGLYDHLTLQVFDLENPQQVVEQVLAGQPPQPAALYRNDYPARVEDLVRLQREQNELAEHAHPDNKTAQFNFRGQQYPKKRANELRQGVEAELEEAGKQWVEHTQRVFATYYQLGLDYAPEQAADLLNRYRFSFIIQRFGNLSNFIHDNFANYVHATMSKGDLDEGEVEVFWRSCAQFQQQFGEAVELLRDWTVPPLTNEPTGQSLLATLLPQPLVGPPRYHSGDNSAWIGQFDEQCGGAMTRVRRLYYKNLTAILVLQEQLEAQFAPSAEASPAT